jgi:hypothetical protein
MLTASETRPDRAWDLPAGTAKLPQALSKEPAEKPWRWPYVAAVGGWIFYSIVAVWMTEVLRFQLGDSLARMADAKAMLFSRDPHLAAIGLYWVPLPTAGQLPFMAILSPLHRAELSGPLATAFVSAVTILVMAKICRALELSRPLAVGFTLVYAFNPIIVYTSGNGMSEAWSFLTCAIAMLGYVRWTKHHRPLDLVVLSTGLAGMMLVRYEAILLAPMIAVAAALNDGQGLPSGATVREFLSALRLRLRRWIATLSIALLPMFYLLGLWCFMQFVLVRDPFFWYKQQKATGHTTPTTYSSLPAHTIPAIVSYTAKLTFLILPAAVVIVPLLLLRHRYQSILSGLGILAGVAVWPAIVILGLIANESAGAPRYFESGIVFLTVAAIWLAADLRPKFPGGRRLVSIGLIAVLAVGAIVGSAALENPHRANIERENYFFSVVFGHKFQRLPALAQHQAQVWEKVASDLDPQLARGGKVLIDMSVEQLAFVYSKHPDRFFIDSDRDYLSTLSDPNGKFNFVMRTVSHTPDGADQGPRINAIDTVLNDTSGGHWVKWKHYYTVDVYHWEPAARSGPTVPNIGG